ncbi:MAG: MFS transporter [Bacteroidetes bacterium]|nr:MFS transporter [Bacteroidota bacterium]
MSDLLVRFTSIPTFRSLQHRDYRLFFSGQIVSLIGTWMQTMAQSWLVYQLTYSSVWLGIVGFLNTIPMLLFALYGGSVADRFSKHRIVLITQVLSLLQSALLFTLVVTGTATVEMVCLLAFTLGTINAFDVPARQALVVELVGKEHLANAIALNSASFNGARIIGPAIGGVIIGTIGTAWCFLLNALSFFAVIIMLLRIRPVLRSVQGGDNPGFLRSLRESIDYVRSDHMLVAVLILVAVVTMFGWSYTVLLPVFADQVLGIGAVGLGNLMMSFGIGALTSAIFIASAESRVRPSRFIYGGMLLFILGVTVFAVSANAALSMYSLVFVGMGLIMFIATANTTIQRRAPDAMRGRVLGLYLLIFQGLAPFGHLGMGWLADQIGPRFAVISGASVCAVAGISMRLVMNRRSARRS